MHPMPIEARARICLAPRRDVAVTDHAFDRVTLTQFGKQLVESQVLSVFEWTLVAALEFDTNGKVVAVLPPHPIGSAGVPSAKGAWNELNQLSIATDEEMGRNPQTRDLLEIGMRLRIKVVGEQLDDLRAAEFVGWQTDGVNDDESNRFVCRSLITVGRRQTPSVEQPAFVVQRVLRLPHSFIPKRAMR